MVKGGETKEIEKKEKKKDTCHNLIRRKSRRFA